jgi:hypothetical protein
MPDTRGLADAIKGLGAQDQALSVQNYLIDHVVTSSPPTTDGATAVFLNIGGSIVQAPYLDSLTTPLANQLVRVLIVNNSPTILGRVIGLPA